MSVDTELLDAVAQLAESQAEQSRCGSLVVTRFFECIDDRLPLHVFDQPRGTWFRWDNVRWTEVDPPRIESSRFAGTGTQGLDEAGRQAIDKLFADSFGAP